MPTSVNVTNTEEGLQMAAGGDWEEVVVLARPVGSSKRITVLSYTRPRKAQPEMAANPQPRQEALPVEAAAQEESEDGASPEEDGPWLPGPRPPSIAEIATYIDKRGSAGYALAELMEHFVPGQRVPVRLGPGKQARGNPNYRRWVDAVNTARAMVEERRGVKYDDGSWEGRRKVYRPVK